MSPWWQLLGLLSWCAIFNQVTSLHSRKTDPQIPLTSAQYSTWTWLHDSSTTRTALVIEANRYIIISFKHVDMGADNQHGKFGQMQNIDYLANPRESIPNTYLYYSHDCDDTLTGHPSLPPHHPSPPHTTHTHTHIPHHHHDSSTMRTALLFLSLAKYCWGVLQRIEVH